MEPEVRRKGHWWLLSPGGYSAVAGSAGGLDMVLTQVTTFQGIFVGH